MSTVEGQSSRGEFLFSDERCYATFAEVLEASGDTVVEPAVSPRSVDRETLQRLAIIGVHYEDHGLGGSSWSVQGGPCNGGWTNVPTWINDEISSTANGCPRIRHREHANLGGAQYDTTGAWGNIFGVMDDETTSIQYLAS